jgi:hypothetical protein
MPQGIAPAPGLAGHQFGAGVFHLRSNPMSFNASDWTSMKDWAIKTILYARCSQNQAFMKKPLQEVAEIEGMRTEQIYNSIFEESLKEAGNNQSGDVTRAFIPKVLKWVAENLQAN